MKSFLFCMKCMAVTCMFFVFMACDGGSSALTDEPLVEDSSSSSKMDNPAEKMSSSVIEVVGFSSSSNLNPACNEVSFESRPKYPTGTLTDSRDGQTYTTIKLGNHWWMNENLNLAYLHPTDSLDSSSFCVNDSVEYCNKYGRLYLWSAAMDSTAVFSTNGAGCGDYAECSATYPVRGVCPEGWHIPSEREWDFFSYTYEPVYTPKFSVEYGGLRIYNGEVSYKYVLNFDGEVEYALTTNDARAYFWSTEDHSSYEAMAQVFNKATYWNASEYYGSTMKSWGASVRCIRDEEWMVDTVPLAVDCDELESCEFGSLTDSRDGQTYKTVKIGNQWWMAENLNYRYSQPTACEDSSSFCYDQMLDSCSKYGRLYLWSAAMDSAAVFSETGSECGDLTECTPANTVRGICPEGWHLPSGIEFEQLISTKAMSPSGRVMSSSAGTLLKGRGWWRGTGLNSFGFSALPAGHKNSGGNYYFYDGYGSSSEYTCFWSTTSDVVHFAYAMCLGQGDGVDLQAQTKTVAYSVRCLKDE